MAAGVGASSKAPGAAGLGNALGPRRADGAHCQHGLLAQDEGQMCRERCFESMIAAYFLAATAIDHPAVQVALTLCR